MGRTGEGQREGWGRPPRFATLRRFLSYNVVIKGFYRALERLRQFKTIPPFSVIAGGAIGGAWHSLRMAALDIQEIATSLAPLLPRDDEERAHLNLNCLR